MLISGMLGDSADRVCITDLSRLVLRAAPLKRSDSLICHEWRPSPVPTKAYSSVRAFPIRMRFHVSVGRILENAGF